MGHAVRLSRDRASATVDGVTSIERTAYPRLKRTVTAQELHAAFTPRAEEIAWAREKTRSDAHVLALVLLLKCYQRLGHFLALAEVPAGIIAYVRGCLDLGVKLRP